jgi:hypothetical protein
MEDEMIFKKKIHLSEDHIFAIEIRLKNQKAMIAEERKEMKGLKTH